MLIDEYPVQHGYVQAYLASMREVCKGDREALLRHIEDITVLPWEDVEDENRD